MSVSWLPWALASAVFAALTAVFGKVGVANINADLATLVRTVVILATLAGIVSATGQWQAPAAISGRTWLFLVLSGLATGASWLCYFRALELGDAARVAPIGKLSVGLVAVVVVMCRGAVLHASHFLASLRDNSLGLGRRLGERLLGLGLGFQRIVTQAGSIGQRLGDGLGTLVEATRQAGPQLAPGHGQEQHEGDGDPECRIGEEALMSGVVRGVGGPGGTDHRPLLLMASPTLALSAFASAGWPASLS